MPCDTKMREGRHRDPVQLLPAAAQYLWDIQEERTEGKSNCLFRTRISGVPPVISTHASKKASNDVVSIKTQAQAATRVRLR